MTSVVVVADSGSVMADLTAAVGTVSGTHIVRHANGCVPLDRLLVPIAPDLVVIGALAFPSEAQARLAEVRRAAPAAKVVILSSRPEAIRLADALRADAATVLPGCDPATLAIVLREVIAAEGERSMTPTTELARERAKRPNSRARRRRPRRARVELPREETAA